MGMIKNNNEKVFNVSPNIVVSIDDNNVGDMYIYDDDYRYVLNGVTASDLIDYFAYNDDIQLSEEIIDMMINMTIHTGTH